MMVDKLMFRCRIFETPEAGYLFMDVHHTLFDGTSSKVFFGDVLKAYLGQPLEPDYYYYTLVKRQKQTESKFYAESKDYFAKKYDITNAKWSKYPTIDNETRENKDNEIFKLIDIDKEAYEKFLEKYNLSPNAFFITACLISTAFYNKKKDVMVSWIYNGRNDANEMGTVGLLFRNLPVAISITGRTQMTTIYNDIID